MNPSSMRRSVSQQWLVELLDEQFDAYTDGPQTVVDLGGGTGSIAAHLAERGHTVTVIDPSPDQLANTQRRAQEMGVTDRLTGIQGDTRTLPEQVPARSVDVLLCHLVLGEVTDRAGTLANIAGAVKSGGLVSLLVRQRHQRVLRHAMDGDLDAALALVDDPKWLTRPRLRELLDDVGLHVLAEHGIGAVADMVRADVESSQLLELEKRVGSRPDWIDSAASFHVLARAV